MSTACPYAWYSDISVNDGDKVYLQDIQQRRIPSHGSRVVPLELWGPEGRFECKVKFDVADVAYLLVSLGKRIDIHPFYFRFFFFECDSTCFRVLFRHFAAILNLKTNLKQIAHCFLFSRRVLCWRCGGRNASRIGG